MFFKTVVAITQTLNLSLSMYLNYWQWVKTRILKQMVYFRRFNKQFQSRDENKIWKVGKTTDYSALVNEISHQ